MSLTLDTSGLEMAVLEVERATGRSCADSLNRAALTAIIGARGVRGAMQLTPKADPAKIAAVPELLLRRVVLKRARLAGQTLTPVETASAIKKERAKRKKAHGYTAFAGWNNASKAVGGRGLKTTERFNKSDARHGTGRRASSNNMTAEIINTAPAAEIIGTAALQQGIDNAAGDLMAYATRRIQRDMDRAQG